MHRFSTLFAVAAALLCSLHAPFAAALVIGQSDTFEDGTTQGWVVGVAQQGTVHPAPPANVADGGPLGAGDNFLRLTAVGGAGGPNPNPGARLSVLNLAQWAGDYTATGLAGITMNLINLGNTDLAIRLYLEDPQNAPPANQAITSAFSLPAGGGWTSASFALDAGSLVTLLGDANTLLGNVTALRIIHSPAEDFRGPPVVAQLGVDNITAAGAVTVPEPATMALFSLAALGLLGARVGRLRIHTSD